MKTRLLTLFGLCLVTGLQSQAPGDASPLIRSPEQLQELLGPIALYPDPLISLILPAATVPSDIVLADRFVASGGDLAALEDKPWDASVKALTRYPDTLKWLDDNLDWTSQVGDAFIDQPVQVMEAIQALRAKAKAMGNLVDTPEERVVLDDTDIRIVPAQPDAIYVPSYDPELVYVQRAPAEPLVYFSEPYLVGPWLGYDFDWRHHHLYRGDWQRGWDYGRDRNRGGDVFINNNISNTQVWQVDSRRRQSEARSHAGQHAVAARGLASIPHPKRNVLAPRQGDSIRRAQAASSGGRATAPAVRTPKGINRSDKGGKAHVATPGSPPAGIKGDSRKPRGNIAKPGGKAPKSALKGMAQSKTPTYKSARKDAAQPKAQAQKGASKPKAQARKAAPKPKAQVRKAASKPKAQVRKAASKPKAQVRKAASKPKAQARKAAPKPQAGGSKDGKKKDKKDT